MTKKGRAYARTVQPPKIEPPHKIRAWREWFDWSQETLCDKTQGEISVSAISAYERGADNPSLEALELMAKAFGIPRGMLLDVDPNDDPPLWTSVLRASKSQGIVAPAPPGGRPRPKT